MNRALWVAILATLIVHMDMSEPRRPILTGEGAELHATAILRVAEATNIDPILLIAVAWEESRFASMRVSVAGACGPLQVKPEFVPEYRRWTCARMIGTIAQDGPEIGYLIGALALVRWEMFCDTDPLTCYNGGTDPGRAAKQYAARVHKTESHLRAMAARLWHLWGN